MTTTNIGQYYNQARIWSDAKLDRHLLARSTGDDTALVQALTLAKISRIINSKNTKRIHNVLEDPEELLKYLAQESLRCSKSEKETVVEILFSLAERYLEECDYVELKPLQAVLRTAAKIGITMDSCSLNQVSTIRTLERITNTALTWRDVTAFAAGDDLILGVHFEFGQKISCKIRCKIMSGYAVLLYGNENFAGILVTKEKFEPGTMLDAYFVRTEKNRAMLTLTPPTSQDLFI